jgi:hypothetical protein
MKYLLGICFLITLFLGCTKKNAGPTGIPGSTDTTSHTKDTTPAAITDTIPASITIFSGNNQISAKGSSLPFELIVFVGNKSGQPLAGILVSFTPGAQFGFVLGSPVITNSYGMAGTYWTLGTQSDAIQSVTAKVLNNSNLSVTFHAATGALKKSNFIGTIRIVDTSAIDSLAIYDGPPDFPALSYNTDMPFVLDSLNLNSFPSPSDSAIVIINGHSLIQGYPPNYYSYDASNNALIITASENENYPNATAGNLYSFNMQWNFTGTIVNNIYSGKFTLEILYSTRGNPDPITGNPGDIYQNGYWRYGIFSTTLQ